MVLSLMLFGSQVNAATYYNGQTITATTTEGVSIKGVVIDVNAKTCYLPYQCISSISVGKVTVPSYIDGFKVVRAGSGSSGAFEGCKKITSVVLPSTVTELSGYCFANCESLTEVSLPNNTEKIGNYSFSNCKSLTEMSLPNNLKEMGNYTFYNCESLAEVKLPNNLEKMGNYTFYKCKKLRSVTIPSKITNIPRNTFEYCESLTSVKLPAVIDSIFYGAFYGCKSLETISLPSSVRYIDNYAFYNCTSLNTITGIANVEYIGYNAFSSTPWYNSLPNGLVYIGKVLYKYIGTMPENTVLSVKEGTTQISRSAISSSNLVGLTIPASVKLIDQDAFGSHSGLESIAVAVENSVYITPSGSNAIVERATNTLILGCNTTVIPPTVKAIGYDAFWGSRLTTVTLPDAVDSLANDAFWSCSQLTSLTVGKGLRKIGTSVFAYCSNLKDIVVSSANPYYESRNNCKGIVEKATNTLRVGCQATVIPQTVKTIGDYAYRSMLAGQYAFTIPNHVETVGQYATAFNSDLRSLTIGRSVKSIGKNAFYGCDNLTVIHALMDTPFEIDETVFQSNKSENGITLRDSIYNHATLCVPRGSRLNYQSTAGWNKFKHIIETDDGELVVGDVFTQASAEGHLLTYQVTSLNPKNCTLIGSPSDISGAVTIPQTTQGYTVTAIGERVFYTSNHARHVTSVTMPSTITSIGENAFYNCEDLVIGTLPVSLESIGAWAFTGCKDSSLQLPAKTTSIGQSAFYRMTSLTSITVEAGNPVFSSPVGSNAIIETATKRLVAGCQTTVIPDGVESIGEYAFNGQTTLNTITIPESVSVIESHAFNYTGLESIVIPATVRSIADYAFRWCNNLKAVYSRNETPMAISDNAFTHPDKPDDGPYQTATLYVPRGKREVYTTTDGWSKFEHIEESDFDISTATIDGIDYTLDGNSRTATVVLIHCDQADVVVPSQVTHEGVTYTVTALGSMVFCEETEAYMHSVTFPATITQVSAVTFARYNPSAIVWESQTKIPEGSFSDSSYHYNFLLYVKDAQVAPSGVENLIVNGVATGTVVLSDGWQFNCPQEFRAAKVSYTHNYTMETGLGHSAGWETLALPFDVQTITHETKGQLVPFASYSDESRSMPFWLYQLGSDGFTKANGIVANTPYIISMPNNDSYAERFNLSGRVTFSATDVTVHRTADAFLHTAKAGDATFIPCYSFYLNNENRYALNVVTAFSPQTWTETPGSIFLTGGDIIVSPFGARIEKGNASARSYTLFFADDPTAIEDISAPGNMPAKVKVYSIGGQFVGEYPVSNLGSIERLLPVGIYIVNGKKMYVGNH